MLEKKVDIWSGSLQVSSQKLAEFKSILSPDELARSERFKFELHRDRYIIARGWLRCLLAKYLEIPAKDLGFIYGNRGKPEIDNASLWFNLSHAENMVVYCFSRSYLVGIDLEYLGKEIQCDRIAQRFFCPQETKLIATLQKKQKKFTFFQLWTAKEAYLKATGEGLVGGLDSVEIGLNSTGKSTILTITNKLNTPIDWQLHNFVPETDFISTLAVQNKQQSLTVEYFKLN